MNREQIRAAFHRAARHAGPLYQRFELYRRVEVPSPHRPNGRPDFEYQLFATAPGALRWQDIDTEGSGKATATLLAPFTETPAYLRGEDGVWLMVPGLAAGQQDTMGIGFRVEIMREIGDAPTIHVAAP